MGNVFRVINSNGDIEITMYRKANAVFKTNEYNETDNICTYKETINIFNLLQENYELKLQLKWTTHCFDEEEHEKLKKQLEEERNKVREYSYKLSNYRCEETYENQQKEFIKHMNSCIKELEKESPNKLQNTINLAIKDIAKIILQKYKETIGE